MKLFFFVLVLFLTDYEKKNHTLNMFFFFHSKKKNPFIPYSKQCRKFHDPEEEKKL